MTTLFSFAIIGVTLVALMLRLTVLGNMANINPFAGRPGSSVENVESQLFPYNIASRVQFRTPASRGNLLAENLEINEYYMSVSIILPETGQELFFSGFIRPGEQRNEITLHVQLPEGVYECIARITVYDPVTFERRGSEDRPITLEIG